MRSQEQNRETAIFADEAIDVHELDSLQPEIVGEVVEEDFTSDRDRYLRTLADFQNYRRRMRRERSTLDQSATRDLLVALLEVMDDFDRALKHIGQVSDPVADGLRLIHRNFSGVLESKGVTLFQSMGAGFDPTIHEAVRVTESDEYESGIVLSEDRAGYLWRGELLRPARVTVVA
jgi:molecular chaperone GrpE